MKKAVRRHFTRGRRADRAPGLDPLHAAIAARMLADAARSGLDAEDVERLGFAPLAADEVAAEFGAQLNAYRIPYFDLDGKPTGFSRARMLDDVGDRPKYLQGKGTGVHIYLPRGIDWRAILADAKLDVLVVEGEKKAAAACLAGFAAVGLGGVDSFGGKLAGGLLPELLALAKGGRRITVVFDSDASTKPQVQRARQRLVEHLAAAGADAGFAEIEADGDDKLGLDDLIVRDGADAVRELLANRRTMYPEINIEPIPSNWLTDPPPPARWPWAGRVRAGTVTVIAGAGGIGKSGVVLRLALALAGGSDHFAGAALTPGRVVYVSGEDSAEIVRARVFALRRRRIERAARELEAKRIDRDEYGRRTKGTDERIGRDFFPMAVNGGELHLIDTSTGQVRQGGIVGALIAKLRNVNPDVIIFDPLTRFHGGDENANSVGTALINACERVATETGAAVIVCHHVNKAAIRDGDSNVTAVRGGSAIVDGARSVFTMSEATAEVAKKIKLEVHDGEGFVAVEPTKFAAGDVILFRHVKSNHARRSDDVFFVRDQHGDLRTAKVTTLTSENAYAAKLAALRAWAAGRTFTRTTVKAATREIGVGRDAVLALIDEAMMRGEVIVDPTFHAKNPGARGLKFGDTGQTGGIPAGVNPPVSDMDGEGPPPIPAAAPPSRVPPVSNGAASAHGIDPLPTDSGGIPAARRPSRRFN